MRVGSTKCIGLFLSFTVLYPLGSSASSASPTSQFVKKVQRQIDSSTHSGHHKTTNPAATDSSDDGCGPPHLRAACCPHAKQKKKREKQNTKRASTRPSKHKASLPNRPPSPPAASRRNLGHSSPHHPDRNSANHPRDRRLPIDMSQWQCHPTPTA